METKQCDNLLFWYLNTTINSETVLIIGFAFPEIQVVYD